MRRWRQAAGPRGPVNRLCASVLTNYRDGYPPTNNIKNRTLRFTRAVTHRLVSDRTGEIPGRFSLAGCTYGPHLAPLGMTPVMEGSLGVVDKSKSPPFRGTARKNGAYRKATKLDTAAYVMDGKVFLAVEDPPFRRERMGHPVKGLRPWGLIALRHTPCSRLIVVWPRRESQVPTIPSLKTRPPQAYDPFWALLVWLVSSKNYGQFLPTNTSEPWDSPLLKLAP